MEKQTFGGIVLSKRRASGMTQLELAEKMGVTDKAVSKWERDLSFPDVSSLPKLAEILDTSVDELIRGKAVPGSQPGRDRFAPLLSLILKGIALAMGTATVVLSLLNQLQGRSAFPMLGVGLACLAADQLSTNVRH